MRCRNGSQAVWYSKLSSQLRKQFVDVGYFLKWDLTDATGIYTGLVVVGKKLSPRGSLSSVDVILDSAKESLSSQRLQELSDIVLRELRFALQRRFKSRGTPRRRLRFQRCSLFRRI